MKRFQLVCIKKLGCQKYSTLKCTCIEIENDYNLLENLSSLCKCRSILNSISVEYTQDF